CEDTGAGLLISRLEPALLCPIVVKLSARHLIIISQNTKQHFFVETGRISRRAPTSDINKYSKPIDRECKRSLLVSKSRGPDITY
ncbi:hypothetical protein ARMSODRAFT_964076, partial [Armillaria solidipes]